MNKKFSCMVMMSAALICLGCTNQQTTQQPVEPEPGTHVHADGTVHANHSQDDGDQHGHSHDNPPHGGTVLDWGGGKYHLELCVDKENQQATVYVLAGNVKDNLPIETESMELALKNPDAQITLTAQPQDEDPEGQSSRFVGTHEAFGTQPRLEGTIFGTIGETPYSGDFSQK